MCLRRSGVPARNGCLEIKGKSGRKLHAVELRKKDACGDMMGSANNGFHHRNSCYWLHKQKSAAVIGRGRGFGVGPCSPVGIDTMFVFDIGRCILVAVIRHLGIAVYWDIYICIGILVLFVVLGRRGARGGFARSLPPLPQTLQFCRGALDESSFSGFSVAVCYYQEVSPCKA